MVCIRLPHCGALVLGSAARAQADGGGPTVPEGHCGPPACTTPGTTSPVFPCYLVSKGNPKQFGAVSMLSEVKSELESPSFRGQSHAGECSSPIHQGSLRLSCPSRSRVPLVSPVLRPHSSWTPALNRNLGWLHPTS